VENRNRRSSSPVSGRSVPLGPVARPPAGTWRGRSSARYRPASTSRCNLHCRGCYAGRGTARAGAEMTDTAVDDVFSQARSWGFRLSCLPAANRLCGRAFSMSPGVPGIVFPFFTNGLLLDIPSSHDPAQPQVIPVLSIEGWDRRPLHAGAMAYSSRLPSQPRSCERPDSSSASHSRSRAVTSKP